MRVLLINPPKIDGVGAYRGERCWKYYPFNPFPLELAQIAGAIQGIANAEISVIDAQCEKLDQDSIGRLAKNWKIDLAFLTSGDGFLKCDIRTATSIKKFSPKTLVAIEDRFLASVYPSFFLRNYSEIDLVVRGEPEFTLRNLITNIIEGKPLANVPNISYVENEGIISTPIKTSDEFANLTPLYSYFPIKRYSVPLLSYTGGWKVIKPGIFMRTSRGCPYPCTFCIVNSTEERGYNGRLKLRDVKNVAKEIKDLESHYGLRGVFFFDETFTADPERTEEFCDELIDLKTKIRWSCLTRVDRVTRKLLNKMKKAGCTHIEFGVETFSKEILREYRKNQTVKQITEAFEDCRRLKVATIAFLMIGAPHETPEDLMITLNLAKRLYATNYRVNIIFPVPKTAFYNDCIKSGLINETEIIQAILNHQYEAMSFINYGNMTGREIEKFARIFQKEFFKVKMKRKPLFLFQDFLFFLKCLPTSLFFLLHAKPLRKKPLYWLE